MMTTKRKNTTRARLIGSALAMLLCVAMLAGTTFAWFSDEAKTGSTNITAGNLDVDITKPGPDGKSLEGADLFEGKLPTLWEPGAMAWTDQFVIVNKGTLALQYSLNIKVEDANPEDGIDLTQVIKMKVVDDSLDHDVPEPTYPDATLEDRQNYWDSITGAAEASLGTLSAGAQSDKLRAVLYWEPTRSTDLDNPDNAYNLPAEKYLDGEGAPKATFSVDVFATQVSEESDSFGSGYDHIQLASSDEEVQDALAHAEAGDIVSVLPGTYNADSFADIQPGVDIQGSVDADGNKTVVDVQENPQPNGFSSQPQISFSGSTVSDMKFEFPADSTASYLVKVSGSGVFENCDFISEKTSTSTAVCIVFDKDVTLRNCTVNSRDFLRSDSKTAFGKVVIEDCTISGASQIFNLPLAGEDSSITIKGSEISGPASSSSSRLDIALSGSIANIAYPAMTVENTTFTSVTVNLGGGVWTSSGCSYLGKSWMQFYLYNDGLTLTFQGDTFDCYCTTQNPGNPYYFFANRNSNGSQASNANITIDGKPPAENWVQPAATPAA